jgi:CRISPR-associated endoribonuclease Cas6
VTGPKLHGALLASIDDIAPRIAREIHDAKRSSPLAITEVRADDEGSPCFEIGVLADDLAVPLHEMLEPGLPLRLGERITCIAAATRYGLAYDELIASVPADSGWSFEFLSPVTFRLPSTSGPRRAQPLPTAELVFGSLHRRWQRFAPPDLLSDLSDTINGRLAVADAQLRTHRYVTKPPRVWQPGSCGRITYVLVGGADRPQAERRDLSALAAFAAYAGVGDATTKGMGHALVEPLSRPTR